MKHYETATAGRKIAHKRPTSNLTSSTTSTKYGAITNAGAWAQHRAREIDIRVEAINRNLKLHEHDPDNDRDLNRLVISWKRQLMELKLEKASLGI
jgi:hypothetical protein